MELTAGVQIEGKAKKQGLGLAFLGKRDHLDETLQDYQVTPEPTHRTACLCTLAGRACHPQT